MSIYLCLLLQEHVVALVLKSAKREATSVGRCVAISSLAVYIFCQLAHDTKHTKVKEAIAVLLAVLKVRFMTANFIPNTTLRRFYLY